MDDKENILFFFVAICLLRQRMVSASCEQVDVGVSWYILDNQLNASSELNASTPAKNGRLNFVAGSSWCASTSDSSPYLQIDLQIPYIICAVSTQGNSQGSQWVESYTLQSSTDGTTWTGYEENGQVKTFNGNFDQNSVEKQILFSAFVARYLRFVVGSTHGGACLRVEVSGIPRSRVQSNIAFFKPTSQSSTYSGLYANNAVDGNKSLHYTKCTLTNQETDPWWRVDLGRVEPVAEVNILNRGDCCGDRLNGAEMRVGNETANGGANNHLCADNIQIPTASSKTYSCRPKAYGRYLYIRIPGNEKILTLCEVEVYSLIQSNIALFKPTRQSSTYSGSTPASNAVDGNRSSYINKCTHTRADDNPWWRVDLERVEPVAEVNIVNRDIVPDRLNGAEIRVGNKTSSGGADNSLCANIIHIPAGSSKTYSCSPKAYGRYLYIRIPRREFLTVCEVEVYSYLKSESCVLDPVGVSDNSVVFDQRFSASSSLSGCSPSDGRLNGSNAWIPATNNDNNDFLHIVLGSLYFVCGVATQGNPNNDYWTKTYKIKTSLDNVVWTFYSERGSEKIFTGNDDKNSIVRSELYEPLAAKFIRFYPVTFHNSKALRVEVYGSKQGCFESFKNERSQTRDFAITASSELSSNKASYSRLYGTDGWCSSSVSLPQYLQADFNQIVTVTGVATQGDAQRNNWVTSYLIRYGYDGKTWISYGAGQHLTGNSDRSTIVVHWFASPFAAQYVRIFPRRYTGAICMRMDLFGCKDYQVSLALNINLDDVRLITDTSKSVTLTCVARYSPRQPSGYSWRKDGTWLSDTTSSLTIPYSSASNIYSNSCARKLQSASEVQCNSTYQCSASLSGIQSRHFTTANVIVSLKKPGQPVVQVNPSDVNARSTLVTWSYSPGADEMPVTAYNLEYRNSTSTDDITLGVVLRKQIINLKPYTAYSVRVLANSVLGKGLWSNFQNFTTKTAKPSAPPQNITSEKMNETTYKISWNPLPRDKANGRVIAYEVNQTTLSITRTTRSASTPSVLQNTTDTFIVLTGLSSCSVYKVEVRAYTSAGPGVFGRLTRNIATSVPSEPTDVKTQNPGKRSITLQWGKPKLHGDDVQRYKITYKGTKDYYAEFKPHTGIQETECPTLRLTITNLVPGTKYAFVVMAETYCGHGGNSSIAQGSTKVDAPLAPVNHDVHVIETKGTSVNVTVWHASQTNGPISDYQVLVQKVNDWCNEVSDWKTLGSDIYIAAQIPSNSVNPSMIFEVGDGKTYNSYENKQLSNGQKYKIYSRGLARRATKKRSVDQNYLLGKASLIAKVQIEKVYKSDDADRQGGDTGSQSCDKPSNTASVISSIVLGIALVISLGVNLYQWRARGISKSGKKYSSEELRVEAHQIEEGVAEVPSPQVESFYMELQPTENQQTSEYGSLMKNPEGDSDDAKTEQDYANATLHRLPKPRENKVYQNI